MRARSICIARMLLLRGGRRWHGAATAARASGARLGTSVSIRPLCMPTRPRMINTLSGLGGFGNGRLQIDFSASTCCTPGAGTATQPIIQIPVRQP